MTNEELRVRSQISDQVCFLERHQGETLEFDPKGFDSSDGRIPGEVRTWIKCGNDVIDWSVFTKDGQTIIDALETLNEHNKEAKGGDAVDRG